VTFTAQLTVQLRNGLASALRLRLGAIWGRLKLVKSHGISPGISMNPIKPSLNHHKNPMETSINQYEIIIKSP